MAAAARSGSRQIPQTLSLHRRTDPRARRRGGRHRAEARAIARNRQPARCEPPMTDRLLRDFAPISDAAWALIDDEARRTVKSVLGGRCVVDFRGPEGWQHSAVAD